MSDHGNEPFPNVKDKLTAPSKKTAFEKARLEAEAKRQREEAETAAVYRDFVASFDDNAGPAPSTLPTRGGFGGAPRGGLPPRGGPGRRHFTGPPGRGGLATQPVRKRGIESAFEREDEEGGVFGGRIDERDKRRMKESNSGLLAFENSAHAPRGRDRYDDDSDSDSAKSHPKPTVHLSSLPPTTNKAAITVLLSATNLKIDSVRVIPAPPPQAPGQPPPSVRKAASALVTLSPETPSSDIDSAVTTLNGRYMGSGFWLSISRHLPSTAIGSNIPLVKGDVVANPFGATQPVVRNPGYAGRGRGSFAPPPQFGGPGRGTPTGLQVRVEPPSDLKTLKLIHKTIESVLEHGPEFEALLMMNENVKYDAKYSWLWDARSAAGVYYRWKLWEILTGQALETQRPNAVQVFEPAQTLSALWIPPKKALKFEWAGSLQDVVEDEGFESDDLDDDNSDREDREEDDRPRGLAGGDGSRKAKNFLGVLDRAKLVHLISRLPTQTRKVRRGDVGRVMAFAMEHAEGGMGEEVVDVLISNVLSPLQFTKSNTNNNGNSDSEKSESETEGGGSGDSAEAKIIGLWLISDVLSNSSLGVRAAWRYRQLFDTALRERGVFKHLGEIYRGSGWGRMKAEKFRRGVVENVLGGWEKWCIFPQTTHDAFVKDFNEASAPEKEKEDVPRSRSTPAAAEGKGFKARWKAVEAKPSGFDPDAPPVEVVVEKKVEKEEDDVDGEAMVDDDVDGEPMVDDELDGEPMMEDEAPVEKEVKEAAPVGLKMGGFSMGAAGGIKRKRPKAEDMFADEEEEE